ncbi:MAG TPA: sigma-70 family RNA polymerase sigma factor [Actinomycetota bacterium]|nr:sigma-70 family RNA polymerase sigma factor [Actinomycetota bacterium]
MRASNARFETAFREEGPRLWRALVVFTADREMASDALAEAFAQAIARGDGVHDPVAWVWRVAFRIAAGALKDRRSADDLARPEASYDVPEPLWDVFDALAKLSPNQRLSVVLHDYADRPTDEVATIIGASRATVYVHLSQGRRRLRRLLEEDDE